MADSSSPGASAGGAAPAFPCQAALAPASSAAAAASPRPPPRVPLPPPPSSVLPEILEGGPPPASVVPFLRSALRSSAFLQGLQDEELHVSGKDLNDLVQRARAVTFKQGDTLIQQGSKAKVATGQPLYVIQSGASGVYVSKKHTNAGQPVRVGSVREGEIVGDMALYADSPPSVSIKSEGDVLAWRIDKAAFDTWIASRPAVKHSLEQRTWLWSALARNYLFRGLDDDVRKEELLSKFAPMHVDAGQPIISYGEHGDRFYVVQQGTCSIEVPQLTSAAMTEAPVPFVHGAVHETDEEDVPASSKTGLAGKLVEHIPPDKTPMVKIAEKVPGEGFGEIALLYNVPRCATVRCVSKGGCGLWSVDAASFLTAASKGSLYLEHIFFQHASVRDVSGEHLMNQKDFSEAVRHTKWTEFDASGARASTPHAHKLNESSLKLMFHLADQSGDNLISFSEFVLLYGLLQAPFTKYQMAFRMFDKDKNGTIDRDEFIDVIRSLSHDTSHHMVNLAKDPFILEIFGPPGSNKQLTYAEFESLLSRDVLPSFLQVVTADLHAVNEYWQHVDLALSQSAGGDMLGGSALSAMAQTKGGVVVSAISWKSLVAGGVAGAISRTLVSPFERLKLLFQMQGMPPKYTGVLQGLRLIHAEDGMKGFFRGNLSNVVRITPASAFQFFFYDCYKKVLFGDKKDLNPFQRLGAGGLAGMTACLLTYPLDFIRARLTLQGGSHVAYNGIMHGLRTVVREQGVRGLYAGLWPSLVGVFPYIGIDFAVYETLRTMLPSSMKNERGESSRLALFACGATAGMVGQSVAYPLDLVRRRLQVQGFSDTAYHYSGGIVATMRQIVQQEGVRGLYKGMIPNYVKVVPAVSVSFAVYEQMRKVLDM